MIKNNIYSTSRTIGGHSLSIVSRLGDMLKEIEINYGERDKKFTILGIELTDINTPRFWFPGNCNNIIIQITENCLADINRAVYQVAHEAVHLLNPLQLGNSNYLEEGLATSFSGRYCQRHGINITCNSLKYQAAADLVDKLLAYDQNIIKNLRGSELISLSSVTAEMISDMYPNIDKELIKKLTTNFQAQLE